MFRSARIKLTAWYLLIIMMVSLSFSIVIYRVLTREVERFAHAQRMRIEHRFPAPPSFAFPDPDLVNETTDRILNALIMVNVSIVVLSGGLAYLLASRTLTPIAAMMEEQNRFISDASHELRTPLTSLKSAMEVNLRDKNLTLSQAKKIMEENISEVNNLQSLSDHLLQLAQNKTPYHTMATIVLSAVIEQAIHKISPLATEKKIQIIKKLEPGTIKANPYSIADLLTILLDNAIKYSDQKSSVAISARRHNHVWEIRIQDHGIGISQQDLPHIFDRFYRADAARSKIKSHGYGLGLAIAKQITDMHNGTINAASTLHKGTTIQVTIPIKNISANIQI